MLLNFAGAMAQAKGQRHAAESKAAEYEYQAKIDENNRNAAFDLGHFGICSDYPNDASHGAERDEFALR